MIKLSFKNIINSTLLLLVIAPSPLSAHDQMFISREHSVIHYTEEFDINVSQAVFNKTARYPDIKTLAVRSSACIRA